MEKIVTLLVDEFNETKAKIFVCLARLNLIRKVEIPTLHWEKTDHGRDYLTEENYQNILQLVEDELDEMKDGPDLGIQRVSDKKVCPKCGVLRKSNFFGNSEKNEDGLTKWCLQCLRQHNEEQHYG